GYFRRILYRTLAVATDFLRRPVVDVRCRLHVLGHRAGRLLVAVATPATPVIPAAACRPTAESRCFFAFSYWREALHGLHSECRQIGQTTPPSTTEQEIWRRKQ